MLKKVMSTFGACILLCGLALGFATPLAEYQAPRVAVDWENVVRVSKTTTTLQVVVNPLLRREFPVSKQIYQSLKDLGADYVRYVPWLPYPRLGVAELEPPSGELLCVQLAGEDGNNEIATLDCGESKIDKVEFASFGTPTGQCGHFEIGKCNAETSMSVVEKLCVGQSKCVIPVNITTFGDPCVNVIKQFAVQVTCDPPVNNTYWDFSVIDPMTLDFLNATQNHSTIINFSTIPVWLYKTPNRVSYPDNPNTVDWHYNQGSVLLDPTARGVGDYYGRLAAWYMRGGFTDEYGNEHKSGYNYNIPYWECLNEPEAKGGTNTPEKYTLIYDEMVKGIQRHADPEKKMKFVGMALEGHNEYDWYKYFLNKSNHEPDIPLDMISFHFYASCHNRTNPVSYEEFFSRADSFVEEVKNIQAIRDSLSPETLMNVDETGVILPGDNDVHSPMFPLVYWNAAGAMYAYLFGKLAVEGLEVLGESQLVGYPELPDLGLDPQYPSVALLNWTNGFGNARYWSLKVLIENFQPGDKIHNTTMQTMPATNPFCGDVINKAPMALQCVDQSAHIDKIIFASYGTPTGSCGEYSFGTCNAKNSTDILEKACLGKNSCSVSANTPTFGDPCFGTVKHLVVEAHCSSGTGQATFTIGNEVYAQGFTSKDGSTRRVLVVNKVFSSESLDIEGATGAQVTMVEESRPVGPPITFKMTNETLPLPPFAVAVVTMPTKN